MANDRVQAKIDLVKGKDETAEVKGSLDSFGGSLSRIGEIAAGLGLERLAEQFINIGKSAATFATDYASNMEQSRIAFDAFTGSVQLGGKALSEVAEFARTTPFELPEIIDAGKQLLGFGFKTDELK